MTDVLLVSMPFGPVFSPSIGLSLLKAELTAQGVPSRVRYFTIRFAELVGQHFYSGIAIEGRPSVCEFAGEWIFSRALFETRDEDEERYVEDILRQRLGWEAKSWAAPISEALIGKILRARSQVDGFLDSCLHDIVRDHPKLVGFTSVFQQHVASLALARRVKQALPEAFIVLGGANCEGVMGAETIRQFPFVDAAVSGEGDVVFPELVRRVLASEPVAGLPGVRTRDRIDAEFAAGRFASAPLVRRMDELPYPDYQDYFEQFEQSRYGRTWQPGLFFETSRGCWWGERMHCTFCGLNGGTMLYRSKSARRALDELLHLVGKYPGSDVQVVDNILDLKYFKDFLPELATRRLDLTLFYETKSNLKKDQVRMLRQAGIRRLQPGIESLSDSVLKLMRKGVSALQNIQLLKWCKELGVEAYWNMLWGFPGEDPDEYARMTQLVPLLTHLRPPVGYSGLRLDRFSPHFFDAEKFGLVNVAPTAPYRYVYPLPEDAVANLAYYFTFAYREPQDVETYARPLRKELEAWRKAHDWSDLFMVDVGGRVFIWDLRPIGRRPLTALDGLDRRLYLACDAACDLGQLTRMAWANGDEPRGPEEVKTRVDALVARGLMLADGSRYLALAVCLGDYAPAPRVVERFYQIARRLGTVESGRLIVPLARLEDSSAKTAAVGLGRLRAAARRTRRTLSASQFSIEDEETLIVHARPCRLTNPRQEVARFSVEALAERSS